MLFDRIPQPNLPFGGGVRLITLASLMAPTLDIIIVNWNTGQHLQGCLKWLSSSRQDGYSLGRVVIVDNASTDGSTNELHFPALPLSLIQNCNNRGFAAACNQAAASSNADYLLFLNP